MKKKFSWKVFISFGLTYSFIVILISGILLYMSPPGRYAHWVEWKILGFTKEGWQALHTVFSYTFVILSIFHLFFINWKSFLSYLKSKKQSGLNRKREFFISTVLTLIFFFGIIFSIQPFKSVMVLGEYLTGSWEKVEEVPPVPHAELFTINQLAVQLNYTSVDEITRKLTIHEIKFENTDKQTLLDIAGLNNTTPIAIYELITKKQESQRQGSGIGRKTIDDFAVEVGKSVGEVMKVLEENGIKGERGQTLRDIGNNNNIAPRDVFNLFSE
jgi:hypothetical protein